MSKSWDRICFWLCTDNWANTSFIRSYHELWTSKGLYFTPCKAISKIQIGRDLYDTNDGIFSVVFFSNNNNNNYKYALDILHFIVHQQCAKDEKAMHQLTTKRERESFFQLLQTFKWNKCFPFTQNRHWDSKENSSLCWHKTNRHLLMIH